MASSKSLTDPTAYWAMLSSFRCGDLRSPFEAPPRRSPLIIIGTSVRASVRSARRAFRVLRWESLGAYWRTGSLTGSGTWKCPSAVMFAPSGAGGTPASVRDTGACGRAWLGGLRLHRDDAEFRAHARRLRAIHPQRVDSRLAGDRWVPRHR